MGNDVMDGDEVPLERRESVGVRAIADALDLPSAPVLQTSTACKSGLAFLELAMPRSRLEFLRSSLPTDR